MSIFRLLPVLGFVTVLAAAANSLAAEPAKAESPLSRQIANFTLGDYRGKEWSLDDLRSGRPSWWPSWESSARWSRTMPPRLQELAAKYAAAGVAFLAIDANQQDSLTELAALCPQAQARDSRCSRIRATRSPTHLAAQRTPEVFVLDGDRRVVYHGRIDDQFTYGIQRPKVEQAYLAGALDQLLAGKPIATPHAEAVGCHIGRVLTAEGRQRSHLLEADRPHLPGPLRGVPPARARSGRSR